MYNSLLWGFSVCEAIHPSGPPQREILEGLDSMGDHDCPRFIYIAPKVND